jgi:hypothetical protein
MGCWDPSGSIRVISPHDPGLWALGGLVAAESPIQESKSPIEAKGYPGTGGFVVSARTCERGYKEEQRQRGAGVVDTAAVPHRGPRESREPAPPNADEVAATGRSAHPKTHGIATWHFLRAFSALRLGLRLPSVLYLPPRALFLEVLGLGVALPEPGGLQLVSTAGDPAC